MSEESEKPWENRLLLLPTCGAESALHRRYDAQRVCDMFLTDCASRCVSMMQISVG